MRGEHRSPPRSVLRSLGSSPHARGAPGRCDRGGRHGGLIPACAGSTRPHPRCSTSARAHPRMRGEHSSAFGVAPMLGGSSPHARGARRQARGGSVLQRLIPACAGSTPRPRCTRLPRSAHPRMRGEHSPWALPLAWICGSSPHARGAQVLDVPDGVLVGLIPACAGSTAGCWSERGGSRAHPRMRGEHQSVGTVKLAPWGSSPHARGAPGRAEHRAWCRGLIPACAGSTTLVRITSTRGRAHPRMRGEHFALIRPPAAVRGSSPHARGARLCRRKCAHHPGLIPACAGSTRPRCAAPSNNTAHPRMRGEHG